MWVERPFKEIEVHQVVKRMAKDKVPGPDEFTMALFQSSWEVVREDVMRMFQEFHSNGKFEKSLNSTFIAFIPKKVRAMDVNDFRPINFLMWWLRLYPKFLLIGFV